MAARLRPECRPAGFVGAGAGLDFAPLACYITGDSGRRSTGERFRSGEHPTKGETMKKTIILTLGAVAAVLIAGSLIVSSMFFSEILH